MLTSGVAGCSQDLRPPRRAPLCLLGQLRYLHTPARQMSRTDVVYMVLRYLPTPAL